MSSNPLFIGYVPLEGTIFGLFQSLNSSNVPTDADSLPTARIYGSAGLMTNGTTTLALFDDSNTTGLYSFSKTAASADGYARGTTYFIRVQAVVGGTTRAQLYSVIIT